MDKGVEERFLSKVRKTNSCWLWTGTTNGAGYGSFRVGSIKDNSRRKVLAHRFAFELYKNQIPTGLLVCHVCDNRSCVNPDHLFLGTHKDNMQDCCKKNRISKGEQRPKSKLTEKEVEFIRAVFVSRHLEFGGAALARQFGVCHQLIHEIVKGEAWKSTLK